MEDEREGRSVERFDIVVRGINDKPEFVEIADKVIIGEEGSGELSVKVRDEETELTELVKIRPIGCSVAHKRSKFLYF